MTLDGSLTASVRTQVDRLITHLLPLLNQVPQPGTVLQTQRNGDLELTPESWPTPLLIHEGHDAVTLIAAITVTEA